MAKCPNPDCQETNHAPGARFCTRCGTRLVESRDYPSPATVKTAPARTEGRGRGTLPSELTFDVNGVPFRLAYVEGGTFYRGITPRMAQEMMDRGVDWRQDEGLEVTQRSFYIGVTPVDGCHAENKRHATVLGGFHGCSAEPEPVQGGGRSSCRACLLGTLHGVPIKSERDYAPFLSFTH